MPKECFLDLVGFKFRDKTTVKYLMKSLTEGTFEEELELVPEDDNEYDENAVAAYVGDIKIGYVAKDETDSAREMIDSEITSYRIQEIDEKNNIPSYITVLVFSR